MSDYIPMDVVNDILKRLPVKSLLKFRCVCKRWRSIISSPDFITQHLSHSSSTHSRTLVRYYSKIASKEIYKVYNDDSFDIGENNFNISFPFHEKSKCYYQIVGYCNGLLCLSDDLFRLRETKTFVIWNPSINRAVNVRPPRVIFKSFSKKCMFALGFGFDSVNNDYKIVRLAYFSIYNEGHHALPPYVEVFSLSQRTWRRVNNNVESYISDHCWSQAPFLHGAVHWVSFKMTRNNQGNRRYRNSILKFDLSTEEFSELGLPKALYNVQPIRMIAATVRGRLSIVHNDMWMGCISRNDWNDICVIWEMKEYNNVESWSLVLKLKMDSGFCSVLHMKRSGIFFAGTRGEPFFCNFKSRVTKLTEICGTTFSFFVDKYVESLVLLENGKEVWGLEADSDYEDEYESVEELEMFTLKSKTEIIFAFYLGEVFGWFSIWEDH